MKGKKFESVLGKKLKMKFTDKDDDKMSTVIAGKEFSKKMKESKL